MDQVRCTVQLWTRCDVRFSYRRFSYGPDGKVQLWTRCDVRFSYRRFSYGPDVM